MAPHISSWLATGRLVSSALCVAERFRKDRSGTVALLFGLTLIPIILAVGGAIDYANANHMRAKLQNALDSAAFAVGREVVGGTDAGAARQVGMDILIANLGPGFPSDYAVNFAIDGTRVTGTASLNVPTYLLGIIGKDHFNIGATTTVNASR
ncbi:MAG: pilus assembly protein [Hyphomicrobiaceae bacterium]|nr:pilus assembly protein [Hyphomicrobiaceae bacterium]